MFLDVDSVKIKIDGMTNYLSLGPYLTQVKYGWNKVWGSDTGRNLKFKTTGTFGGVVPKLRLMFGPTTQQELETLAEVLDAPWQTVRYYDPKKKAYREMETYTGDWATLNKNTFSNVARANESFEISAIATEPRK